MARYSRRAERHAVRVWRDRSFLLRAGALMVLLAGMWLPPITIARPVYTVVAVLDITLSMNVRDQTIDGAPASRIAMEKRAAQALLARLPCGSRFGLAIFVEREPFLLFEPVEICENFSALDQEIGAIDWRMGWDSESHISEALLASLRLSRGLGADLVFMTDGQETPPLSWFQHLDFGSVRGTVRGLVLGVGGRGFSPIPKFDAYGREIGVYRPGDVPSETAGLFRGREHLSAVDEAHLRALAGETGLEYRHLDDAGAVFGAYDAQARKVMRRERVGLAWMGGCLAMVMASAALLPQGRLRGRRVKARCA